MKVVNSFALLVFSSISLSISTLSQAQKAASPPPAGGGGGWAFRNGSFTPTQPTFPNGAGGGCTDTACSGRLQAAGVFNLTYTTDFYWSGDGEVTSFATLYAKVSASGDCQDGITASSSSTATAPVKVTASGGNTGGGYSDNKGAAANQQGAQTLKTIMQCAVSADGYANALVSVTYSSTTP